MGSAWPVSDLDHVILLSQGGLGLDYGVGKNAKKLLRNMRTTPKQKVVVEKEGTLSTMEKD